MSDIGNGKELIQKGKKHILESQEQIKGVSEALSGAKGNIASAGEAVLDAVQKLRLVADDYQIAASQTRSVLSNLHDAKDAFNAAGAESSPFEAIRNTPIDLVNCHEALEPLADRLQRQERLADMIGLLATLHKDITDDRSLNALNSSLGLVNDVHKATRIWEGRAVAWDAML